MKRGSLPPQRPGSRTPTLVVVGSGSQFRERQSKPKMRFRIVRTGCETLNQVLTFPTQKRVQTVMMSEVSSATASTMTREHMKKCAIVTGSTSGIGLGIARSLAASGMNVLLNGLGKPQDIEALRKSLAAEFGTDILYSPANMAMPNEIAAMVGLAAEAFGRVDVLVNNAGIQHVEAIETFPAEKWDAILAINLSSAFHASKHVIPMMKANKWGRIINVASAHGLVASPFKSAYVAAKHGLLGLTKTIALETAEFGITVNAVCPGYVLTPLVQQQIPQTAKARGISEEQVIKDVLLHAQPTRQFVTTEQLGALTSFLCSDAAASITGTALPVDGGWTAQ